MIDQQIVLLNLLSPNQIQTQDYINPTKIISKLTKLGIQNQLISNPTKLSETAKKLDFSKIDAIVILISAENNSNTLNSLDQLINNIPEDFLSNILILVNPAERAYDGGQHNHIFNYDQIVEKLYNEIGKTLAMKLVFDNDFDKATKDVVRFWKLATGEADQLEFYDFGKIDEIARVESLKLNDAIRELISGLK